MNKKRNMFFKMILSSLVRRRSRMLIALLAIIVGATVLFGLVTIYYDVPRQMSSEFRNYGANMVFISSGDEKLTDSDVSEGVSKISKAELMGYTPYKYQNLRVHDQPVTIAGVTFDTVKTTSPYWYINGEMPSISGDLLVGKNVAENLVLAVGDAVETLYVVEGDKSVDPNAEDEYYYEYFTVTGILETGGSEEDYMYMSLEDLKAATNSTSKDGYDVVEVSVSTTSANLEKIAQTITNSVENIQASLVKRVTSSESSVLGKLQMLILLVTIIITILTIICVATTMNAVVNERRKEIALRKSIGASNSDIIKEYMTEVMTLGLVGGIVGSLLGFGFAEIVSMNVFSSSVSFIWWLLPISLTVSMVITGLSSFIPVRNAIAVEAAKVLKGE